MGTNPATDGEAGQPPRCSSEQSCVELANTNRAPKGETFIDPERRVNSTAAHAGRKLVSHLYFLPKAHGGILAPTWEHETALGLGAM